MCGVLLEGVRFAQPLILPSNFFDDQGQHRGTSRASQFQLLPYGNKLTHRDTIRTQQEKK